MKRASVRVNSIPRRLREYDSWCRNEGTARYGEEGAKWGRPWGPPFVVYGKIPSPGALASLERRFGSLPRSYVKLLETVGYAGFRSGAYGVLKILSARRVVELYRCVQHEIECGQDAMERWTGDRGPDLSAWIPVMAGEGLDGCWALLDTSHAGGRIMYWDTDQSGFVDDVYPNLASFFSMLLERASGDSPLRLT